jgi:hypothetical protein
MVTPRGQPADTRGRSATAPVRQFTGIHIGSVEVRVQPAPVPAPVQLSQQVPAPSSAAPAPPLARGLTSSIGLRQS